MRPMNSRSMWTPFFFEKQEWYVRLMLEGEDRLAKNRESSWKGKTVFLPCGFRGLVFPGFPGIAAFGAVDRKRTDPGADGTSDRTAERYCDPVFLLWQNTVGNCTRALCFPAYGFPDAHGGASPDAERAESRFLSKKSRFQEAYCMSGKRPKINLAFPTCFAKIFKRYKRTYKHGVFQGLFLR